MKNKVAGFQSVGNLFLTLPETEFAQYCLGVNKLWHWEPQIKEMIEADLDQYGKEKKRLRLLDKQWEERDQLELPSIAFSTDIPASEDLKLLQGRPRMAAYVVFMYMMGRGYYGGIKSSAGSVFAGESLTLTIFLQNQELPMPSANCVYDNINAISNETRLFIMDSQIRMIADEGLDDFKDLSIDSTSVAGNVCWPRDSAIISQLVNRIFHRGSSLHKFGLADLRKRYFPRLIRGISSLSKRINMEAGKPKSQKKRRQHYRKLLKLALEAIGLYKEEFVRIDEQMAAASMEPSQYQRASRLMEIMREDVANIQQVHDYCSKRIFEGKSTPSKEKIISISDPDAAYIQKGNREATIGYKPQLGRSGNGFVSSILVPVGNAADSDQLDKIIKDSVNRTGVTPDRITADDGYVNKKVRDDYLKNGVSVFSFSGSKGKRLLTEAEWESEEYLQARNDRSAVESLMYTIKFGFDFGRVVRRGIDKVRAELLEKVLAYNCCRVIEVRHRQEAERLKKAAA